LVSSALSDVCFDKPQDISLSNIIIGPVSVVDESDNDSGLVFMERARLGRGFGFFAALAPIFLKCDASSPNA
jgi:hypothetical protein